MKKLLLCLTAIMMFSLTSYSASTSWATREGDWFKWNVSQFPEGTHNILLFAITEHFDSPIWINQGTYQHQVGASGDIGQRGGTKVQVDGWWVDESTQFYVECLTGDAKVYTWVGDYSMPYKKVNNLSEYVIARSDRFSAEYLASNNYIGSDLGASWFDFSGSLHSVPEPSSGIMILFGLSFLALRRKMDTANNCPCFKILENNAKKGN